jgi:hypothetical protein
MDCQSQLHSKPSQVRFLQMLWVLVVSLAAPCFAQRTTGTLRGQVLDPQGAVVAAAKVTVTNEATGVAQLVQTTSAGTYNLPSLIPGKYT